jgi:competence protein ComEC
MSRLCATAAGWGQAVHSEWRLLLLAALFCSGCALYICVEMQPPGLPASLLALTITGGLVVMRRAARNLGAQILLVLLLAAVAASARIQLTSAPRLTEERYASLEGHVESFDRRPDRAPRLVLKPSLIDERISGLPERVRLIVRTRAPHKIERGSKVALKAILAPPSPPVVPGGYDFARAAFFDGIGAEGYAASSVRVLSEAPKGSLTWRDKVERARDHAADEMMRLLPTQAGAVAVALTVGDRHFINEETSAAIRDAGLAHLLAISGLHMGLITAAAFFVFEYLFAALPSVALRVRPKKIAAVAAWGIACAYLLMSGMGIATVRAFIMICVALLAVLYDRRVLSLRSIALAVFAVLILWPEAVLSVSFQMSFAATAALVAVYELLSRKGWTARGDAGPLKRLLRFIFFMGFTSLVAQLAIAPFALYHFQTLSIIGIVANIVVVPIMSAVIMPLALLSMVLMPFGLHAWPVAALGLGLDQVIALASYFAHFPFAVYRAGAPGELYLAFASLVFALLLGLRAKFLSPVLLAIYVGLMFVPFGRTADVLLDRQGRVIARADSASARLLIVGGRRDSYRDENWRRYWGLDLEHEAGVLHRHCDASACRTALGGERFVTVLKSMTALRQACNAGDIVVGPRRWLSFCEGDGVYLFEESFEELGTAAIYYPQGEDDRMAFRWSKPQGKRPWH